MAHAAKAKVMMGNVNKTDKLDAQGLATLLHLGSLPTVWLPSSEIRDERELHRTRMAFSKQRTALKNRLHSTLAKYAQSLDTGSDIFAPKWRPELTKACKALPPETQRCMHQHLVALDHVQGQIKDLEERIKCRHSPNDQIQRRQDPLRKAQKAVQPVPQMGLYRGRQCRRSSTPPSHLEN